MSVSSYPKAFILASSLASSRCPSCLRKWLFLFQSNAARHVEMRSFPCLGRASSRVSCPALTTHGSSLEHGKPENLRSTLHSFIHTAVQADRHKPFYLLLSPHPPY
ncbi:hypothetical protein VTO42DRAFT_4624 [Malbranchea cinnamomea]